MLNRSLIDREFAFLKDAIFLNVASVSMPPLRVQEAYGSFMARYVENFGEDVVPRSWQIVAEARTNIAALLNCKTDEIAFVKNTAEGIGIIANGYPLEKGDNIIVIDCEHSANLFAWINIRRKGVELRVVKNQDPDIIPDDIFAMMDEKTKILAISAVQFTTGFYADLEAIGAECKRRGILFVVDGIQAYGRLDIDVRRFNIDWMACGGNKGSLATLGVGFIYCREDLAVQITPPYAGYQSVLSHLAPPAITEDFEKLSFYDHPRRFESGNLNYAGIEALSLGATLLGELGIRDIEEHVLKLDRLLRDELAGLSMRVVTPKSAKNLSGIVCIYYSPEKEQTVVDVLKRHKIYATMRGGYIRLGIDFYNTVPQMKTVAAAMFEIERS